MSSWDYVNEVEDALSRIVYGVRYRGEDSFIFFLEGAMFRATDMNLPQPYFSQWSEDSMRWVETPATQLMRRAVILHRRCTRLEDQVVRYQEQISEMEKSK